MAAASATPPKHRAIEVDKLLAAEYPDAEFALRFSNPLQLLIATILSAQCTDVRVNMVTPALFKKYPTAAAMADAKRGDIEKIIQSTGFFRQSEKHPGNMPHFGRTIQRPGSKKPRRIGGTTRRWTENRQRSVGNGL